MKTSPILLAVLTGSLLTTAAHAQVELTITGSTAFRAITIERSGFLYDAGSRTSVTNDASAGRITFSGTMSNAVPALGSTPVKVRLSFSGSAAGMLAVKNSTPVSTAETPGVNINKTPDVALSDVFPSSATPPIAESSFNRAVIGVVPFVYVRNNAMTGVTNITREQAVLLMNSSGVIGGNAGMPATYLGGTSPNPVYLIGRDSGSGTRISVHKVIGYNSNPVLWATNGAGTYVLTNGYPSGGNQRDVIKGKADAIGYLGLPDFINIQASATRLSYQGVPFTAAAVATGSYSLWGYEHLVNRAGGLSANQLLVKNALVSAITDPVYQSTVPAYNDNFVSVSEMQVERGADGGPITALSF